MTGAGGAAADQIGTGEIAATVRDLLDPLDVYEPDGRWSEPAERAACGRLADGGWLGVGVPPATRDAGTAAMMAAVLPEP